jgi:hypothetical protein
MKKDHECLSTRRAACIYKLPILILIRKVLTKLNSKTGKVLLRDVNQSSEFKQIILAAGNPQ